MVLIVFLEALLGRQSAQGASDVFTSVVSNLEPQAWRNNVGVSHFICTPPQRGLETCDIDYTENKWRQRILKIASETV